LIHSRINKFQGSFGTHNAREPGEGVRAGGEKCAGGLACAAEAVGFGAAKGLEDAAIGKGFKGMGGAVGSAVGVVEGVVPEEHFEGGEGWEPGVGDGEETVSAGVGRGLGLALSGDGATGLEAIPAGGFALGCGDGSLQQARADGSGCGHDRNLLRRG
jgi:hypothetical protein